MTKQTLREEWNERQSAQQIDPDGVNYNDDDIINWWLACFQAQLEVLEKEIEAQIVVSDEQSVEGKTAPYNSGLWKASSLIRAFSKELE